MNFIEERINQLEAEMAILQKGHDALVIEYQQVMGGYQQRIQQNQNRFQGITGAITELRKVLQYEQHDNGGSDSRVNRVDLDRVPGIDSGLGGYLRVDVGDRELDQSDPAPGETGDSDSPGDPGRLMGG